MKTEHIYAQALRWVADGEYVEAKRKTSTEWVLRFPHDYRADVLQEILKCTKQSDDFEFRIKPRTIAVNGREVQAGETTYPKAGTQYYYPLLGAVEMFSGNQWLDDGFDLRLLERGLVHLTKEAAIAHAKAMLDID